MFFKWLCQQIRLDYIIILQTSKSYYSVLCLWAVCVGMDLSLSFLSLYICQHLTCLRVHLWLFIHFSILSECVCVPKYCPSLTVIVYLPLCASSQQRGSGPEGSSSVHRCRKQQPELLWPHGWVYPGETESQRNSSEYNTHAHRRDERLKFQR